MITLKLKFSLFFVLLTFAISTRAQILFLDVDTINLGVLEVGVTKKFNIVLGDNYTGIFGKHFIKVFAEDQDSSITLSKDSLYFDRGQTDTFSLIVNPVQNMPHTASLFIYSDTSDRNRVFLATRVIKFQGRYKQAYYSTTENKRDEELKQVLKTLLATGYTSLSYNAARDAMYGSIDNIAGKVECVYTGTKATFSDRSGATANNFDCEHTFPQGFFSQVLPERSDIHHLFPTTSYSNNRRGNDPFGYVSNPSWDSGGSKWSNGVFEPRDFQKGRTARAMLYFVLRYRDYSNFLAPQESVLRQWHFSHLPDAQDIQRNNQIYLLQKNRNPLVDYPQMLHRITSVAGISVTPTRRHISNHRSVSSDKFTLDEYRYVSSSFSSIKGFGYPIVNVGNAPIVISDIKIYRKGAVYYTEIILTDTLIQPGGFVSIYENFTGIDGGAGIVNDSVLIYSNATNHPVLTYVFKGIRDQGSFISEESAGTFKIYPNPAKDLIYIEGEEQIVSVGLWDMHGCRAATFEKGNKRLCVSHLPSGNYILIIETPKAAYSKKIVVE
jgi:hypothetical protein